MKSKHLRIFILSMVAILCGGGMYALSAPNDAEVYYQKITSVNDLTTGEYLIVNEAAGIAFDGSLATLDAASDVITVTAENGIIASSEIVDKATFTIDTSTKYIKSASGFYIGINNGSNGLKQNAAEQTKWAHTFGFDEGGNALIVISGGEGETAYSMTLTYNKAQDQNRFRYYKNGGQEPVQLYKKVTKQGADPQTWTYRDFGIDMVKGLTEEQRVNGTSYEFGVVVAEDHIRGVTALSTEGDSSIG